MDYNRISSNAFRRALQATTFYRFAALERISGNAGPFLLPFRSSRTHFGQCRPFPFTVSRLSNAFRAMKALSFYRFATLERISGNADPSFYRFAALERISGNADPFLLPFRSSRTHFGQCSPFLLPFRSSRTHFGQFRSFPFTVSRLSNKFRAMQCSLLFLFST